NLEERFRHAGIRGYKAFVADLSVGEENYKNIPFKKGSIDLIILDVPCSGSGTWGRSPEYLRFFDEKEIDHYAALQKKILTNSIPYLKKDGIILYSTCSVF